MRFVPKFNVRAQLTIAIFLAIFFSWILSAATTYYFVLQDFKQLRQDMLANPEAFHAPPPPEPRIQDFLFGSLGLSRWYRGQIRLGERDGRVFHRDPSGEPPERAHHFRPSTPPARFGRITFFSRLGAALLLAIVMGAWLSRKFTRPLAALERGAQAFHAGRFEARIPVAGADEFSQVATTMNEMAGRVSAQLRALEEDANRRQQLLADVAHELRSPVTTLRTMSGALEEGLANDPERRTRAVRSMVRTSDRMLHLVTDLLELAKLDLKELPLHLHEVDLRELAAAVILTHQAAAAAAGITLHPVETGAPVVRMADADRLAQVLDNLLDNAISYAGANAELFVLLETTEAETRLMVKDTGQGISAEHLPYLFDPFYRVDMARTPKDNHSGLGLRIARGLIEAHGATLHIESESGQGTTAIITFPR